MDAKGTPWTLTIAAIGTRPNKSPSWGGSKMPLAMKRAGKKKKKRPPNHDFKSGGLPNPGGKKKSTRGKTLA